MTFEDLDLHPRILAGLGSLASQTPTPVQQQALPPILEGRDVLVLAPSGNGKAMAFVLPILQRVCFGPRGRVQAIVLTPTQELAEAILNEIQQLGRHTRARSLMLGSGPTVTQLEALRDGVEIIVACPAQLVEYLNRGSLNLAHVTLLVLEELDLLCDMGFLPDLWRILKTAPAERQTVLFSTRDDDELRRIAQSLLRAPLTVQLGDAAPAPLIAHRLYPVATELKTETLLSLLDRGELPTKALLIFCETRFRARRLGEKLKHAGYAAALLTDELSPKRRDIAIEGFRQGIFKMIVTTDVAAQGLNVTGISHIVNFDLPVTVETYLHRSGRAAYGNHAGTTVSLVTPDDEGFLDDLTWQLDHQPERRALPRDLH